MVLGGTTYVMSATLLWAATALDVAMVSAGGCVQDVGAAEVMVLQWGVQKQTSLSETRYSQDQQDEWVLRQLSEDPTIPKVAPDRRKGRCTYSRSAGFS